MTLLTSVLIAFIAFKFGQSLRVAYEYRKFQKALSEAAIRYDQWRKDNE